MDREEDGWEVVKLYLSDDLASDSEDERQLFRTRREAAVNKKNKEANKQKETVSECPLPPSSFQKENPEIFSKSHQGYSGIRNNSKPNKTYFSSRQQGHFQYFCPVSSNRDWEFSDKTEEISVCGRLKENSHFWKNELKPSLFVPNIINNFGIQF